MASPGASTVPESKMTRGRTTRQLSIRDETWNISARSPLEEIQAAALRAAPMRCVAQHRVPPTEPQM